MGIEGFFAALAALLLSAVAVFMTLLLRRRPKAAALYAGAILVVAGIWYVLPLVDSVASVLFFPEDTVFSARYSEESFRAIGAGESTQQVLTSLGEPLARQSSGDGTREIWYYSKHGPRYDNYWNKIVVFDAATGQVVKKVDEFYSD